MSTFASPPRYNPDDARAYVDHLLALVGDRAPLTLMGKADGRLAETVSELGEADARRPEREGAWSVLQIVRHLADSEIVYGYRLRLIVAADQPAIPGYDQDAWASLLHYHHGTLADALADRAAMRRMNLRWLHALDADQWERIGRHNERGDESVRQIAVLLAGHDLIHEAQIRRVREALSV